MSARLNPHRRLYSETVRLNLKVGEGQHVLDVSLAYDRPGGMLREVNFVGRGKIGHGLDLKAARPRHPVEPRDPASQSRYGGAHSVSIWTHERRVRLAELWAAGLSTAEIGRRLGCTKNSVISKAHQLALAPRSSPIKRHKAISPAAKSRPKPRPTLVDMSAPQCAWPMGHPGEAGFRFCDERATEGRPYCREHAAKAYQRKPAGAVDG